MLKYLALGACLTCAFGRAAAAEEVTYTVFGMGLASCAHWQSSPATLGEGEAWVTGYWSGLNFFNENNHRVGSETDLAGIIAEIKKVCAGRPSMTLSHATNRAYEMLEK
jgi:hypothetical protein